jgi:hypothetical protein
MKRFDVTTVEPEDFSNDVATRLAIGGHSKCQQAALIDQLLGHPVLLSTSRDSGDRRVR